MKPGHPHSQAGIALAFVLIMFLVLGVIGFAFMGLTQTRFGLSYKAVHYNRALYIAEAGLQWSLAQIDRGRPAGVSPNALPFPLRDLTDAYHYTLEVLVEHRGPAHRLTSRATVGGLTVVLEARRDLSPLVAIGGRP